MKNRNLIVKIYIKIESPLQHECRMHFELKTNYKRLEFIMLVAGGHKNARTIWGRIE